MKDYTQIEHINKYIEERMKHCYDAGYEQGCKDEKARNGCDEAIKAFARAILMGSIIIPSTEDNFKVPLSEKCCCEKEEFFVGDVVSNAFHPEFTGVVTKVKDDSGSVVVLLEDGSLGEWNDAAIIKHNKTIFGVGSILQNLRDFSKEMNK